MPGTASNGPPCSRGDGRASPSGETLPPLLEVGLLSRVRAPWQEETFASSKHNHSPTNKSPPSTLPCHRNLRQHHPRAKPRLPSDSLYKPQHISHHHRCTFSIPTPNPSLNCHLNLPNHRLYHQHCQTVHQNCHNNQPPVPRPSLPNTKRPLPSLPSSPKELSNLHPSDNSPSCTRSGYTHHPLHRPNRPANHP